MPSLQTIGQRFENNLLRADGFPFKAAIMPLDEGAIAAYDFTEPRVIMRLRHDSTVGTGDVVIDPAGRRYLLADHDQNAIYDTVLYKSHRCFLMNKQVLWEREAPGVVDPLTKLKKSAGKVSLGTIDVLVEQFGREDMDFSIKVREQTRRLVTGADIQLNDIVDNMVVKRLDKSLGVWLAEIE